MAKNEQVRIDLTAKDDASKTIDKVADAVEELERVDVEIPVNADTDKATRAIGDVGDEVQALSRADAEIVLKAKVDAAQGELKALRTDLEQTGDKADDTARHLDKVGGDPGGGLKTRGNAIADLTGPLGDASGAASDFAGVFDGIGDIAEDVTAKLGMSAEAGAAIGSAIGGLGIAIAGAAAAWSYFSGKAAEARKRQEEIVAAQRKINEALEAGDTRRAAEAMTDAYGDIMEAARKTGAPIDELTRFISGQSDEMPEWERRIAAVRATMDAGSVKIVSYDSKMVNLRRTVKGARDDYIRANGSLGQQKTNLDRVEGALRKVTTSTDRQSSAQDRLTSAADRTRAAFDRIRSALSMEGAINNFTRAIDGALADVVNKSDVTAEEILDIKQSIVDVAEYAGLTPIQVQTLLDKVDAGDYLTVKADVERLAAANPILLAARVKRPPISDLSNRPEDIMGLPTGTATAATSTTNVYMTLARGYREHDVVGAAERAARRSGGLYRRTRR